MRLFVALANGTIRRVLIICAVYRIRSIRN